MTEEKGRAFWVGLAREVGAGATQVDVARRHGVSVSALGYWTRRLRKETPSATLLPVRVAGAPRPRVEVIAGDVRIAFDDGTDPDYVAAVVRAIRAC